MEKSRSADVLRSGFFVSAGKNDTVAVGILYAVGKIYTILMETFCRWR